MFGFEERRHLRQRLRARCPPDAQHRLGRSCPGTPCDPRRGAVRLPTAAGTARTRSRRIRGQPPRTATKARQLLLHQRLGRYRARAWSTSRRPLQPEASTYFSLEEPPSANAINVGSTPVGARLHRATHGDRDERELRRDRQSERRAHHRPVPVQPRSEVQRAGRLRPDDADPDGRGRLRRSRGQRHRDRPRPQRALPRAPRGQQQERHDQRSRCDVQDQIRAGAGCAHARSDGQPPAGQRARADQGPRRVRPADGAARSSPPTP